VEINSKTVFDTLTLFIEEIDINYGSDMIGRHRSRVKVINSFTIVFIKGGYINF
jgi:hypothetical protein